MQTLQSYIRDQYGHVPDNWLAWFCLNSDNERTAIWLDCKFDVPKRGLWLSESVVSLSVSQEKFERGYPGLLIFECKSLDAEEDELEKYAASSISQLLLMCICFQKILRPRRLESLARSNEFTPKHGILPPLNPLHHLGCRRCS